MPRRSLLIVALVFVASLATFILILRARSSNATSLTLSPTTLTNNPTPTATEEWANVSTQRYTYSIPHSTHTVIVTHPTSWIVTPGVAGCGPVFGPAVAHEISGEREGTLLQYPAVSVCAFPNTTLDTIRTNLQKSRNLLGSIQHGSLNGQNYIATTYKESTASFGRTYEFTIEYPGNWEGTGVVTLYAPFEPNLNTQIASKPLLTESEFMQTAELMARTLHFDGSK